MQLVKRLAEGARVAEVSAGHDDPVGHFPAQRFEHAEHDRLLPFQPEGIDAVDQVDAQPLADLLHAGHRVVEIAGDLHGQRAVVEGLRELAVGDFARADEDHGLHQPRDGAVEGQRGAGVAGRGAGGVRGADQPGVAEGGRHAVVLEAARGIHSLILQVQPAGRHAGVAGHAFGGVQQRLPFADGDALPQRRKRQQVVKSPHAAETMRIVAMRPFLLEGGQGAGNRQPVPVVQHVQQAAATVAGNPNLVDGVGRTAGGRNTLLVGGSGGGNRCFLQNEARRIHRGHQSRRIARADQGPRQSPWGDNASTWASSRRAGGLTTDSPPVYNQKSMETANWVR